MPVTATTVKDFQGHSYLEWDFKEGFYRQLEKQPYRTNLQLMFRTREPSGLLFKVQNMQKSEYMILEVSAISIASKLFSFNKWMGRQKLCSYAVR